MKIALIHTRFQLKGGLETRLFNYINYFLCKGHEVDVYTSEIDSSIEIPNGVSLHHIDVKRRIKPLRNTMFNKKLKTVFDENNYDFALSLERTDAQKHVLAPNTHKGFERANSTFFQHPLNCTQTRLDKKAYNHAEVIYACSDMIKKEVETLYNIDRAKIHTLYPPIQSNNYISKLTDDEVKDKFNLAADKIYFAFVSTSHNRKGFPLLKKIFNQLPDNYHLLVAGTKVKESRNISSLGFVQNMADLYKAAHCLVHPSIYEPFGQIVVEAIANRLPVFVSNRVGAKEIVSPSNGLVLPYNDVSAWENAIFNINKQSFSFENKDKIIEELSLDNHMKKMLGLAKLKNRK